jgi:transcriptional regulator with XRE-family HTH domain
MENLGQRLKDLRVERKLSLRELSKLADVSVMSISRWENNQSDILSESITKLAKYFGVTTDYLLGLEN